MDIENGIADVIEMLCERDSIELGVLLVDFLNGLERQVIPATLHTIFKGRCSQISNICI